MIKAVKIDWESVRDFTYNPNKIFLAACYGEMFKVDLLKPDPQRQFEKRLEFIEECYSVGTNEQKMVGYRIGLDSDDFVQMKRTVIFFSLYEKDRNKIISLNNAN